MVDDERDIARAISAGLEQNGFSVDVFNDPVLALASFKPNVYGLIISDIKMPKMNGFEMVFEMQKIDNGVEVMFFTGHVDIYRELSKLFDKMKVRDVIEKPISIKKLLQRIDRLNASRASGTRGKRMTIESHRVHSPPKPRKQMLELIVETTKSMPDTLAAIYQAVRPSMDASWQEFTEAVEYLTLRGDLQARGNGFDVIYSVTEMVEESPQQRHAQKNQNRATAF